MKEIIKKPLVRALLGVILTPSGSFMGYIYIQNIGQSTPLLMILAIIMVPSGLYLLAKLLTPSIATLMAIDTAGKEMTTAEKDAAKAKLAETLNKNNEMLESWNRTNKTRDELKLLEVAESVKAQEKN